ncbi:MAG: TolC family protein [Flavobacteriales bacterium]
MKRTTILLLLIILRFQGYAQKVILLDSCVAWAKSNYPLLKQNQLFDEVSSLNIHAINEAWLPKLNMNVQGVYQSEVVQFNIPGMTTHFPHDSYIGSLSIEQTIFDGGLAKKQREIEGSNLSIEKQKNEIELYKLIERINQLYTSILLGKENLNMLTIYKDNLLNRRKNVAPAVENGLSLASSLDEIDVEILKIEQNMIETTQNLKALLQGISILTGKSISEKDEFSLIALGGKGAKTTRPELKLLDYQLELLESRYSLATKMALPKVYLNVAGNYGRPGPNFINQDLRAFGSAGLSVRWNISTLYGLNREKSRYEINKDLIDIQREAFLLNTSMSSINYERQIDAMNELIQKDASILEKRSAISKVYSSQLDNGKITVNQYLIQLNEEMTAKLNQKIHEIKRMNAESLYYTTNGINF